MKNLQEIKTDFSLLNLGKNIIDYWCEKYNPIAQVKEFRFCPIGAATLHPESIKYCIDNNHNASYRGIAFLQRCIRPTDGHIETILRSEEHLQAQIMIKNFNSLDKVGNNDLIEDIKKSLENIIDISEIIFMESKWSSPSIGASGIGWEVRCAEIEIAQITFFNKFLGRDVDILELTYGVERVKILSEKTKIETENNNYIIQKKIYPNKEFLEYFKIIIKNNLKIALEYKDFDNSIKYILSAINYFNIIDSLRGFNEITKNILLLELRKYAITISKHL